MTLEKMNHAFTAPRRLSNAVSRLKKCAAYFLALWSLSDRLASVNAAEPRIVNIYNFIRNSDYRLKDSEEVMFDCTRRQIECLKSANLSATWALQYDALINPRYQKLLKDQLSPRDEIAAWWEIPQPLAEKAGIKWSGRHEWDPAANVGFSPGYNPYERRKLVDVYMDDFKAIFGRYPRTVGSWFIDEVTLQYMEEKYGIVASCNCKDQIGTDFYTLWGGYWNQAYYPSRLNSYMPAQTRAGQIDVPVFRMLGSDPIYQHGTTPGLQSLEPVYRHAGGSPRWVAWFMNNLIQNPSLEFGYTQAGQENSFGWEAMNGGLTNQIKLFAAQAKSGLIQVETLEQTGRWFRKKFRVTPATSVVVLDDWKDQGRKTVWYDSRFYRFNILWEKGAFFVRDIHCFNEDVVSPTHTAPLKETSLVYETLPVVDWAFWSDSGHKPAGMFPVLISGDGGSSPLVPKDAPVVKEKNSRELSIEQSLQGGGTLSVLCAEDRLNFNCFDEKGKPMKWAWNIVGGDRLNLMVTRVSPGFIAYHHSSVDYRLKFEPGAGSCRRLEDGIQLMPNNAGKLVVLFDTSSGGSAAGNHDSALIKE